MLLVILKISSPIFASLRVGSRVLGLTSSKNVSVTLAPELSVAPTSIARLPTSEFVGVPLKVRVRELNVSQSGKLLPFFSFAE